MTPIEQITEGRDRARRIAMTAFLHRRQPQFRRMAWQAIRVVRHKNRTLRRLYDAQ